MMASVAGAAIAVICSVGSTLGVNVQKLSHSIELDRPLDERRPYHKRQIWWLGMTLVVIGSFGDFFALGLASQTIVASLGGGSTFLANLLFARCWLNQLLYVSDIIGISLIMIGVITAACMSVKDKPLMIDDMYHLMKAKEFIIYVVICIGLILFIGWKIYKTKKELSRTEYDRGEINNHSYWRTETNNNTNKTIGDPELSQSTPNSTSNCGSSSHNTSKSENRLTTPMSSSTNIMELLNRSSREFIQRISGLSFSVETRVPLYWGMISGILGGQSVLVAKCTMMAIFESVHGRDQFTNYGIYLMIAILIALLMTQTHILNLATSLGDTISVFPVFQSFWIAFSNISGIVFFQQTNEFTIVQWILFPVAFILVVLGITLIAKHQKGGKSRFSMLGRVI